MQYISLQLTLKITRVKLWNDCKEKFCQKTEEQMALFTPVTSFLKKNPLFSDYEVCKGRQKCLPNGFWTSDTETYANSFHTDENSKKREIKKAITVSNQNTIYMSR